MTNLRVGTGYDSHRFDAERELVLGGVIIPDHPGLTGHSDGDALAHAVIDAILGAAGRGERRQSLSAFRRSLEGRGLDRTPRTGCPDPERSRLACRQRGRDSRVRDRPGSALT